MLFPRRKVRDLWRLSSREKSSADRLSRRRHCRQRRGADVIYVSNSGNNAGNSNTIEKINSAGVGSVFASTGLSQPTGLAFDSAGNLYVANYNINTIEKFTPNGVGSLFASTGLNHPYDLAFDHQGNLFAANSGNDTIEKFTSGGVGSLFASTSPGSPNGLAVDAQDNVYAGGNDTIEKFTPGGVGSVFASVGDPFGLAFGPDGYLYVSQNHTTITRISPTGGALGLTTNFVFRGIAFDSGGNLVGPVDSNIFLGMVTSGGANSGLLVSGLNGATVYCNRNARAIQLLACDYQPDWLRCLWLYLRAFSWPIESERTTAGHKMSGRVVLGFRRRGNSRLANR